MTSLIPPKKPFRLRSFVRRDSRLTSAQARIMVKDFAKLLPVQDQFIDYTEIFGRSAPCYLEIGFGSGQSLVEAARVWPEADFIGVETHRPGVGALLLGLATLALTNVRVFNHDVVDVLETCLPPNSLEGIQIFFPDPWPKRKHHPRRLIQPDFVELLVSRLKPGGTLHLATDWEHYAVHMMKVLSQSAKIVNLAGSNQFAARSAFRPLVTKFERRALREGRSVWELQFSKI